MGDLEDWEAGVARDPRTPPQALADIAERRYDLHPVIAAHPRVYPELREWMRSVNPTAAPSAADALPPPVDHGPYSPPGAYSAAVPTSTPPYASSSAQFYPIAGPRPVPPPQRRKGIGCWIAGCGCLAVAVLFLVVLFVLGGVGAMSSSSGGTDGQGGTTGGSDPDTETAQHLADFDAEIEAIRTLGTTALAGNPVAPLVIDEPTIARLQTRAADPDISSFSAESLAYQALQLRQEIEATIAAAEQRRATTSGLTSEALVDEAGNGFIDIIWDATEACSVSEQPDWETTGCVKGGDALTIHLVPDSEFGSDWSMRMTVIHELAHVYQNADAARFEDRVGDADRLVDQGLFVGSSEAMADCYALTYYNEWTLEDEHSITGYGYICTDAERQEIRNWAAALHVPMP